jgi:UDP-glucose 4-epimerase
MRVVVVGATGNVGTSLLEALGRDETVESVLGLARRRATASYAKTTFAAADVTHDDLVPHFRGADCVVHLAWLIQPSRDLRLLHDVNVGGSARVFAAAAAAGVPKLVVASSIGVYSPGPKRPVDESWPRDGVPTSWYARHKAEMERLLDRFEGEHDVRVVRLRPALIMKRESSEEIRRLFTGPFLPSPLVGPGRLPVFPHIPGAVVQVLHSLDAGEAYRLAVTRDVEGAFNVAVDEPVDGRAVAAAIGARTLTVPARVARALAAGTWRARLQPTSPDWLDLALGVPLLDSSRAREELGWAPRHGALATVTELLDGIADRAGGRTPPLRQGDRRSELAAGVGARPV